MALARQVLWLEVLWLVVAACALAGCNKQPQRPQGAATTENSQSARAAVPLRVWFVGDEASRAIIERQWQAASERPLELRMLRSDELLKTEKCTSDVVVSPAHLIGELIERQWLVELPVSLTPGTLAAGSAASEADATVSSASSAVTGASQSDSAAQPVPRAANAAIAEEGSGLQPPAWLDQSRYGRNLWGLSLGVTTPMILTNFKIAPGENDADQQQSADDAQAFWQVAIAALSERASGKKNDHSQFADADREAICDRYLLLLTSISRRESRFGALLDPETLKARLSEPEFIEAAKIMLELHRLNAAPEALAGSYTAAWNVLSGDAPALSIGVPPLPTADVDKVTSIAIRLPPTSPGPGGARAASGQRTMGWNSGHGLVASLTAQCRQTGLAIEFMRWLGSESARNALARNVDGVSASAIYAPGSSAWQAQRLSRRIAQQPRLPNQPRLPGSADYRQALGEQLAAMLRGELEPEAAMKAAAAGWDAITAKRDEAQLRASYEASLGL